MCFEYKNNNSEKAVISTVLHILFINNKIIYITHNYSFYYSTKKILQIMVFDGAKKRLKSLQLKSF